ncbi:MAG: anti-sigma factor antagonist [Candidatus Dadabacteria bacterium]|nr:MAG: anti-sigma factor antagonist [Candidatus Dadabacteria bacterium]
MQSVLERDGTVVRVVPAPGLVASAAEELRVPLREAVEAGATEVVFDLGGVDDVDSVGIGLLLATHNTLGPRGGRIRVVNAGAEIVKLLRTMRLDRHFPVEQAS